MKIKNKIRRNLCLYNDFEELESVQNLILSSVVIIKGILLFTLIMVMGGCFSSTQSYNNGKLLDPGDAKVILGYGGFKKLSDNYIYNDSVEIKKSNKTYCEKVFSYRLGLHDKYPFGEGLEFGLLFQSTNKFFMSWDKLPYILEFDLRGGLPDIVKNKYIYHHNVDIGWIVGKWVDCGFFAGYSGGFHFRKVAPYAGIRIFATPTNIDLWGSEYTEDGAGAFKKIFVKKKKKFGMRGSLGCALKLPRKRILPDKITPEIVLFYPRFFDIKKKKVMTVHIGFTWSTGL